MTIIKIALAIGVVITAFNPVTLHTAKVDPKANEDLMCLAKNIYHEARGEPLNGQRAVAQVTINRTKAEGFPSSICEVVYQHKQFSWTLNKQHKVKDWNAWNQSMLVARQVLAGEVPGLENFKAIYFHTKQVRPWWKKHKQIYAKIGNHIFYV